jgi:hypothetical protein
MRSVSLLLTVATLSWSAQMTGYISDAACGWNNARATKEARECAQKCVKVGWDPVFVRDGQMDVLKVADKSKVLPYVGDHVTINAERKGDTLTIKSIRRIPAAAQKGRATAHAR